MKQVLLVAVLIALSTSASFAHDPTKPELDKWYQGLMQPDNPRMPCCSYADAYFADGLHVRDGKTFATITDERDDAPLNRHHVPLGKEIEVPNDKLKWDNGNPTGHAVIFLNINDVVLCYVQGSGI